MTLVLELDPETETRLRAEADARGLAVEACAQSLLGNSGPLPEVEPKKQTVEDFREMLRKMAEGSENRPILPPEAFERESFYEDRW